MAHRNVIAIMSALGIAAGIALPAAAPAGAAPQATVALAGTGSPAAASTATVGAVPAASPIDFELVLTPRSAAGAQQLATAVSDPASAQYRHYLTAAQWEARFSPTKAQVATVTSWLAQQGFTGITPTADRLDVSATGTAAQVEHAFGTTLSLHSVQGRTLRLANSDLSVPTGLAGLVVGAAGVSQTIATPDSTTGSPTTTAASGSGGAVVQPPGYRSPEPCGSYYGQKLDDVQPPYGNGYPYPAPYAVCGYTPPQLRTAYDLPSAVPGGANGKGTTVAIVDAYVSPTLQSDAAKYASVNDPDHLYTHGQFSELLAKKFDQQTLCQSTGWYGEQTLDVEAVHATAPGAKILYVGASDCVNGLWNALQKVVDGGLASVVSNSWGDSGGDLLDDVATRTSVNDILTMAAATGISVLNSSGDGGDEFTTLGFTSADFPASSPWITAVGGTTLQIGAAGQRLAETGWSTGRSLLCTKVTLSEPGCSVDAEGTWLPITSDGGSGGGTSYDYTQPPYQAGIVPTALATRNAPVTGDTPYRVVPDISMDADPGTGFLVGETQEFPDGTYYDQYRIGGTSVASPLFAGVVADATEEAGIPLGFLNPALYGLDRNSTSTIYDARSLGLQDQSRVDYANGISAADGLLHTTRIIDYEGPEQYCDGTGNCATRDVDLSVLPGYDDMTGLGAPSTGFVAALAKA